jgi:acyl-homoserine-lactone acylase
VYRGRRGDPVGEHHGADAEGNAWYIDASATPRLSQGAIDGWLKAIDDGDFLPGVLYEQGLVVLDGGDSGNEWVDAPGARPGIVPYAELPQIDREDYVFNANDSHWLSNPAAPLEGYSPLHGFERVPQSPRTRMNIRLLADEGTGTAAGADGKFTLSELQEAMMGNRSMTAELLLDAVVERCEGVGKVTVIDVEVEIAEACATLAGWDGRFDADSVGAVVWREFLGSYNLEQREGSGSAVRGAVRPGRPGGDAAHAGGGAGDGRAGQGAGGARQGGAAAGRGGVAVDATLGRCRGRRGAASALRCPAGRRATGRRIRCRTGR